MFNEREDQDHFLAGVFEDESRIGFSVTAKNVWRHYHGQARDVHLRHGSVFGGREHLI